MIDMSNGMVDEIVKTWDLIEKAYDMQQSEIGNNEGSLKMWNNSSTGVIFALWSLDVITHSLYQAICGDLDFIYTCRLRGEENGTITRSRKGTPYK